MRDPDCEANFDPRVSSQRLLDLEGGDICPTGLDQARKTTRPVQDASLIEEPTVLRAKEALGVKHMLWLHLVVPAHESDATHGDLTRRPGR